MADDKTRAGDSPAGLETRRAAVSIVDGVLYRKTPLDDLVDADFMPADPRERAMARMIAATTLRRHGALTKALEQLLERPLSGRAASVRSILLTALCQIFFMETKPHAIVDQAVRLAGMGQTTRVYRGLVNGVLRNALRRKDDLNVTFETGVATLPDWLANRWTAFYGKDRADAAAASLLTEPALDLSVKSDPDQWAKTLGGHCLPQGTVRLIGAGAVPHLAGYDDGAWWVQDAASRLPVMLFGDVTGQTVLDLCAAPGGKTAQLAAAGADVIAVDRSKARMGRLAANMDRLGFNIRRIVADATVWKPDTPPDAILLDAPCSATGTIRRHPDLVHLKTELDITKLADLQTRLLVHAADCLKPGGRLIYSTCSLEPEEGEDQMARFLAARPDFSRVPITPDEMPGFERAINPYGDARITPECFQPCGKDLDHRLSGSAGFFIARLEKSHDRHPV